ncbi:MAG: sulfotransferase [Pseudomonadota bacterium]
MTSDSPATELAPFDAVQAFQDGHRHLFCVGATKAGTSWLYNQLREHPECGLGWRKEVTYFEDEGSGILLQWRTKFKEEVAECEASLASWKSLGFSAAKRDAVAGRQARLSRALSLKYLPGTRHQDYLDFVTDDGRFAGKLTADVTPSYARLRATTLAEMAALGPGVRFLYILRNPVDRAWSHVRMALSRDTEQEPTEIRARRRFGRFLKGGFPKVHADCDYAGNLSQLVEGVPEPQRMVLYYEDLFTQEGADRLADFLGIARFTPEFERVVHGGTVSYKLPAKLRLRGIEMLRDQYSAMEAQFGRIPEAWQRDLKLFGAS